MMSEDVVVKDVETVQQYVCFVKRRAGAKFVPYTEVDDPSKMVVKSLREFLDHDISKWYSAGQEDKVLLKVSFDQFVADVNNGGMNSFFAGMLGWNYPDAARLVESEGWVFILTCHPRFESLPFSYRRVCEEDYYALELVERLWSLRGGQIVFEEYDPAKHVSGYQLENKPD
jgi:hypothetical protein